MSARRIAPTKSENDFESSVKGKKFKNPDTGKMVLFKSLPNEEQKRLRSKFNDNQDTKDTQSSSADNASEEQTVLLKALGTTQTKPTISEEKAKSWVGKFLNKAKNVSKGMASVIKNAPLATKQFITDTEFRNKAIKKSADILREQADDLAKTIVASTKSETADFARPFTAPVTMLKRLKNGEKPLLTKKEKFSLFSGLVYWGCIAGSFSMSHLHGTAGMSNLDVSAEIGDAFMHSYTLHIAFGTLASKIKDTFKSGDLTANDLKESIENGTIKTDDLKKAIDSSSTLSEADKINYLEQLANVTDDPNKLFLFIEQIENTDLFLSIFDVTMGIIPDNLSLSTGLLYNYSPWAMAKQVLSTGASVISKLAKEDEPQVKEYSAFLKSYADQMEKTTDEDMLYLSSLDSKPFEKITKQISDSIKKGEKEEKKETTKKALQVKLARSVAIEYLSRQSAYQEKKKITNQDGKESTVYVYSDEHIRKRNKKKSKQIEKLRKCMSDFRAKYRRDIESEDQRKATIALAVSLIDLTYERVGNPTSADNGHFGITGLQKRHIKFSSGKATLTYVGKSGVKQTKEITDEKVVAKLKEITKKKSKEDNIFTYGDNHSVSARLVNTYLKDFGISAKDIRGFHANEEMKKALKSVRKENGKLPTDEKQRARQLKKEFATALKQVAKVVGHQHSTLKNQYLVPHLEETFLENGRVITSLKTAKKTESEKEDQQVEDIHKPNPKERPPRFDLRKRKIQDEDKDLDNKDKDLSLKHEDYKRASLEERVAMLWIESKENTVKVWDTKTEKNVWVSPNNAKDNPRYKLLDEEEDTEEEDTEIDEDTETDEDTGSKDKDKEEKPKSDKEENKDTFESAKSKVPSIASQIKALEKDTDLSEELKGKILEKMSSEWSQFNKRDRSKTMTAKEIQDIISNRTVGDDPSDEERIQAEVNKMIVSAFLTNPSEIGDKSISDPVELGDQVFTQITQYDSDLRSELRKNIETAMSGLDKDSDEYKKLFAKKETLVIYDIMLKPKNGVLGVLSQDVNEKNIGDLSKADFVRQQFDYIRAYFLSDNESDRKDFVRAVMRGSSSIAEIEENFKGEIFTGWTDALSNTVDPEWDSAVKEFLADHIANFESKEEYEQALKEYEKEEKAKSKGQKRDKTQKDKSSPSDDIVNAVNDFLKLLTTEQDIDSLPLMKQVQRSSYLMSIAEKNGGKIPSEIAKQLREDYPTAYGENGIDNAFEENLALSALNYEKGNHWKVESSNKWGAKNKQGLLGYFDNEQGASDFAKGKSQEKTSSLNFQSFIYNSMNIDSDISINNSTKSIRRDNIMSKMNKQSALKVSNQLDHIATLFENSFKSLGVPEKIAKDFSYRCDLLSDTIEQNFGIDKQALDGLDPVLEPGFNPDDIGREVGGPLEDQGEHSWIDGEFSRQEHRELRDLQESGDMSSVQEDPRAPIPGKQANEEEEESSEESEEKSEKEASLDSAIARLSKQADLSMISKCSDLRDHLKVCCIKLKESGIASVKSLSTACDKLVSALDKIKEEHIKSEALGSDSVELEIASEKACGAVEEIAPFIQRLCMSISHLDQDSPVAQFQVEEMLEQSSAKLEKLVGLAVKIVADALSEMSAKGEE